MWTGPGRIACTDWPDPTPGDDLVIVAVSHCGFCGTDASIIDGRFAAGDPPRVLGHEVAGVVVEVGAAVRGVAVGDRVACNIFGYCGSCSWCQAGQVNHCGRKFRSAQGFAQYAAYQADQVYRLPGAMPLEHAALLEPVANCVHAVDLARLAPGERVLVLGGGTIGLLTAVVARMAGAATVVVVEPDAAKRETARALGADDALDPATVDLAAYARDVGPRGGFDVAFEASGATDAVVGGISALAQRGRLVVVSIFDRDVTVPVSPFLLHHKEINLTGALATAHTFPRALATLARLDLDRVVTAREPLERLGWVYRHYRDPGQIKTLVHP